MVTFLGQATHPGCKPTEAEIIAREFVDAVQREDVGEADRLGKILNSSDKPARLGSSAVWYAKQGWHVFPLAPNSKQPLFAKRRGGKGLHDATTDVAQVKEWWTKYPDANIGLVTGRQFDVIDVDGPEGILSLSELSAADIGDVHGRVSTPKGVHLYVPASGDGNRQGVKPGIDYRGVNGYVCAPPSQVDFKRYTWTISPSPQILGVK